MKCVFFPCCRAMPFVNDFFFSPWCLSAVVCSSMHTRSIRENVAKGRLFTDFPRLVSLLNRVSVYKLQYYNLYSISENGKRSTFSRGYQKCVTPVRRISILKFS